jgi:hypothetical protein
MLWKDKDANLDPEVHRNAILAQKSAAAAGCPRMSDDARAKDREEHEARVEESYKKSQAMWNKLGTTGTPT